MSLKVLIPTSGKGVNLGEITQFVNKALVKVGKKPAISYIIDAYPKDTEFVVTTGYFGNQVRDFFSVVYPDRKVTFVDVDIFEGAGSSLIYSILKAKDFLQSPFIYHACDTVILDPINSSVSENWIIGYKDQGSSNYAGFNSVGGIVEKIFEKGAIDPDYVYVGVMGIQDYKAFWESADYFLNHQTDGISLDDVSIISRLLSNRYSFKVRSSSLWFDTGNVDGLIRARKEIPDSFHILDKLEESIYIYDDFVVKFFYDQKLSDKRVKRAEYLGGLVPKIEGHNRNFFRYKFVEGRLYSRSANSKNFVEFLQWSKDDLWKETEEVSQDEFRKVCYDFYYTKSVDRINKFLASYNIDDQGGQINGEYVPSIWEIFKKIDFDYLCGSKQTLFHGDFILDNIIQTNDGFCLLDWRQDFGGLLKSGDMYYDLAKLNHNLTINHDIVNSDLYSIEKDEDGMYIDIHRRESLVQCQQVLHKWIVKEGYDLKKIKLLTAIIWLNMSPLHHHPFDKFLFYFGKYNLWKVLNSD